jgi:uncharacterized membrane protein YeaQ/YmgE (transglycosylase-associated protein family)
MDIVISLVLGVAAGFLAVLVMYRTIPNDVLGWLGAIVIGLAGGWVGGWLADLVGLEAVNWLGSFIIAFIAAVILLMLLQRVAPARR